MTPTELDQARTLSILSESPHLVANSLEYVAFAGYVMSYSDFCTIFMWALCGQSIYNKIWQDQQSSIESIKALNIHDSRLQAMVDSKVGPYLARKFKETLKNIEPEQIENLVENLLEHVI